MKAFIKKSKAVIFLVGVVLSLSVLACTKEEKGPDFSVTLRDDTRIGVVGEKVRISFNFSSEIPLSFKVTTDKKGSFTDDGGQIVAGNKYSFLSNFVFANFYYIPEEKGEHLVQFVFDNGYERYVTKEIRLQIN